MKVLFAVNNEKISQAIVRKYQEKYKEIISAKNVYYFNAIIKELQRNRNYDRIVISEDLEPFSNKNYDMIDKFLFEKMDSISDEASNGAEGEIPIILICTDRREKGENVLLKMFSIGVYSALIGNDRTIDNVCQMINTPRNKKEAKIYYKIDSDGANYKSERLEDVSETEIQNILNHYKRLGKNEDKYVESFNSIASQYTQEQLRVIVPFLPLNVRAVLEEKCDKYKQLMLESVKEKIKQDKGKAIITKNIKTTRNNDNKKGPKLDILNQQLNKPNTSNPVVIPSGVDTSKVKRVFTEQNNAKVKNDNVFEDVDDILNGISSTESDLDSSAQQVMMWDEDDGTTSGLDQPAKRKRGRPAKEKTIEEIEKPKRGRGRPPKQKEDEFIIEDVQHDNNNNLAEDEDPFPFKNDELYQKNIDERGNIFGDSNDNKEDESIFNDNVLPGLDDDIFSQIDDNIEEQNTNSDIQNILPGLENDDILPGLSGESFEDDNDLFNTNNQNDVLTSKLQNESNSNNNIEETAIRQANNDYQNRSEFTGLVTGNNKVVAFVGTSKNGTSFLVNNLAALLSSKGINTAILDLTKNKNAYYIYTQNDENLRNQAYNCINQLRMGNPNGIKVNKNLTVYTTLPNETEGIEDYEKILETLTNNYSLVLMDCDFDTNYNYFDLCQEMYLVQSYDILTIQPLTAFLKELLDRNILKEEKLKVVINKELKVKGLNEKMIIGGISSYNDPSMSLMKKLFDKDTMQYITVPFEIPTYSKYLEGLVTCDISLKGYSSGLLNALNRLGEMVYPLINAKPQKDKRNMYGYNNNQVETNNQFNRNMDATLNKMRRNY